MTSYWYDHHHCWPNTLIFIESAGVRSMLMSVATVGMATASRIRNGTIVQPISTLVLPWICVGSSSSVRRRRRPVTMTKISITATMRPTTPAAMKTGTCSRLIFSAFVPFGSKMVCGCRTRRQHQCQANDRTSSEGAHQFSGSVVGIGWLRSGGTNGFSCSCFS